MARNRELPHAFAHIDQHRSLPARAELTVAALVIVLVVALNLSDAIAVSGVAVLTYYAITNAAALTLPPEQRRWPRAVAMGGLVGCLVLVVALPLVAIVGGFATLTIGVVVRAAILRRGQPKPPRDTVSMFN